ncbi:MAG TPA: methyltransferase domain-containing protein [Roseimicrobium sp.]|nr:methyltransferase domain-containing protein [Roseimicrobium sp.]
MDTSTKESLKKIPGLVPVVRWVRRHQRAAQERHWREPATVRAKVDAYLASGVTPRLQIGTGPGLLPEWLNTDFEPVSAEVAFMDATQPFPLPDGVFERIFSEHMIEHIPYGSGQHMLRECHRIMKPGGRIRIATPDLTNLLTLFGKPLTQEAARYLEWSLKSNYGTVPAPCPAFVLNAFVRNWGHQFIYDEETLSVALHTAGFADIRRARPGLSDDPVMKGLEGHARQIGHENNEFETLVLEATRP